MNMYNKSAFKRALMIGTVVGMAALPGRAMAWGTVYVSGINPSALSPVTNAITQSQNAITNRLQTNDTDIVGALRDLSGQNISNAQSEMKLMTNIASGQDARNVVLKTQQFTLNALDQASSGTSACNVITGAVAGSSINAAVSQYQEQGTDAELAWLNGGDKANPSPSYNGTTAAMQQIIAAHCQDSATQEDIEDGLCPPGTQVQQQSSQPGTSGGISNTVPLDVNAGALFDRPEPVLSKARAATTGQMMAMIFAPHPFGSLPANFAQSASGKKIAYNRLVSEAQSSAPYAIAMGIAARQEPLANQGKQVVSGDTTSGGNINTSPVSISQWVTATMAQIPGHTNISFPDGISEDVWLKARAEGWYMNPNWAVSLNSDSAIQAIKDGVMINAFRTYLQYKQYRLQEQDTFLLAELVSMIQQKNTGGQ